MLGNSLSPNLIPRKLRLPIRKSEAKILYPRYLLPVDLGWLGNDCGSGNCHQDFLSLSLDILAELPHSIAKPLSKLPGLLIQTVEKLLEYLVRPPLHSFADHSHMLILEVFQNIHLRIRAFLNLVPKNLLIQLFLYLCELLARLEVSATATSLRLFVHHGRLIAVTILHGGTLQISDKLRLPIIHVSILQIKF